MTYQTSFMPSYQFTPPPPPMAQPVAAAMPQIVSGVTRWAMKYPNLWQAVQKIAANFRTKVTPEQLWSIGKRMGLPVLTSIIGAAAVQELMLYKTSHKRRRMNVANTKALRRSLRRLGGFDRLSRRVSAQLASNCHRRPRAFAAPRRGKRC